MTPARRARVLVVLAIVCACGCASAATGHSDAASAGAIEIDGVVRHGQVLSAFVMPAARVNLRAPDVAGDTTATLETGGHGVIEAADANQWRWRAPSTPGHYGLALTRASARIRLNVFVKAPFANDGDTIGGYRVGRYETVARPGDPGSAPPTGLVEVTPANRNTRLSPHFTLAQFLCHQQPAHWPKYVLVQPRLLEKLERLRAMLVEHDSHTDALTIMSGYRTPWYNADIGNTTVYSQHLFGSAADVFVDGDDDGRMDDLDGDGQIDIADAQWLADRVAALTAGQPRLQGGLSAYPGNAHHGPFVHLDVRGVRARW